MRETMRTIHPELRFKGSLIRCLFPYFTEGKMAFANKMARRLLTGRFRKSVCRFEEVYIARRDGGQQRLCVYTPVQGRANPVPGLLWIHGGGYGLGVPEQDNGFIEHFVEASGCVVVSPDYRVSLTAPYPAAFEDCYDALLWLRHNGKRCNMREDQIFVGGDSAGGGLAAAVSLCARDTGEVSIAFQMPLYPMLDDRMNTPSAIDNDAPIWNSKSNELGWRLYLGALYGREDVPPYAAPARALDYRGLPPTCTYVGSIEPFYDETRLYIDHLKDAHVPVHFKVFDGCFHAFDLMGTNIGKSATMFLMDTFLYATKHYFKEQLAYSPMQSASADDMRAGTPSP